MEPHSTTSFDTLYATYAQAIFRFAYIKTGTKDTAEDIVAETFCRYFEYSKTHTTIAHEKAFLYRIATNYIIDQYRKKGASGTTVVNISPDDFSSNDDTFEKSVIQESYRKVREAMKYLKKEYEDVLILHYIEELSIEEIATIYSSNENSIRVRLHRAVTSLRKHFPFNEKEL